MDLLVVKVTGNDVDSGMQISFLLFLTTKIPLLSSFPVTLAANKSMKMTFLSVSAGIHRALRAILLVTELQA